MSTSTYVRKSVYDLNEEEQQNLRNAFQALYEKPVVLDSSVVNAFANSYQELANILITAGHYQRNDLLFLPWARAYFFTFEQALRKVDASITLPYWDYTSAQAIEEGIPSLIADPTYHENGVERSNPLFSAKYKFPLQTYREVDENTKPLIAAGPVRDQAMQQTNFIDFSLGIYPVDIFSHAYIGGSSANTNTAAYDPIFWFTHCQLDHFWYQWQQLTEHQQVPSSVEKAELKPFLASATAEGGIGFLTGADVLDTANLGYTYG